MEKSKSNFRGKVGKDGQKSDKPESYLNLPKGVELYIAESEVRKVKLDFLPYVVSDSNHPCKDEKEGIALEGNLWYRRPFKVHRNVGSDNRKFICPKSIGKPCPICDYQKKMFNEGRPKEETTPLYPQTRSLYIVLPLDQKGFEEIPYVWDMANTMFQEILIEELGEDPSNEVFPDLEEGKTLEVRLKWKTIGEKGKPFPEATNITFLDREPYDDKILDEVPDLDKVLKVLSYEELSNKFFELDNEEKGGKLKDVNEDEPRTERRRRSEPADDKEKEPTRRSSRREIEKEDEPPTRVSRRSVREEKEKDDEPPTRSSRRERDSEKKPTGKNPCPHGHKFGIDIDNTDDCPDCESYDDCLDESEKQK